VDAAAIRRDHDGDGALILSIETAQAGLQTLIRAVRTMRLAAV
jgi:hypothetical protein